MAPNGSSIQSTSFVIGISCLLSFVLDLKEAFIRSISFSHLMRLFVGLYVVGPTGRPPNNWAAVFGVGLCGTDDLNTLSYEGCVR